jgi:hypothetical protein
VTLTGTGTINSWVMGGGATVQSGCAALSATCSVKMNATGTVTVNSS